MIDVSYICEVIFVVVGNNPGAPVFFFINLFFVLDLRLPCSTELAMDQAPL